MNIRYSFLLLVFHFCFVSNVFAQYKEGYVISNEEDTIRGYIQYLDWEVSPTFINFKTDLEAPIQKLGTDDIFSFAINSTNEYYEVKSIGLINIYQHDVFFNSPSVQPKEYGRVFLQIIIKGPEASLYKYVNEGLETHFYIQTPIIFQELTNYSYYENIEGKTYVVKRENYKEQLQSICINAAAFQSRLPAYTEAELIRYLEKYNSCFLGETIVYRSPRVRATVDPIVGVGYDDWFGGRLYTIGARVNFPKQHYNRFFRATANFVPGAQLESTKFNASLVSIGLGRYWGTGNIRPYLVPTLLLVTNMGKNESGGFLVTINAGISFRRQIELEVGHWNNFIALVMDGDFILPPSISLHYSPNFWKKKK